jgi:hypothetical protein
LKTSNIVTKYHKIRFLALFIVHLKTTTTVMNKLSHECPAWLSTFLTCGRDNDNKALSVKNNGMALNGLENNPFVNDFKTFSL